jgi:Family of unknown function (DUF5872)
MKPEPVNKNLYNKVKSEAKKRFKAWPSAYGSAWLVKEYKLRGGKFKTAYHNSVSSKRKTKPRKRSSGLARWFDEKWINVCKLPKKVPCGRSKSKRKQYPYCRPSIRVNKNTPKIASQLSRSEIKRRCSRKRKNPSKRIS